MKTKYLLLLLLLLLVSSCACAQTKKTTNCADAQTQLEMNNCAAQEYKGADATLNKVYKALTSKLATEQKKLLVKAQQSWLLVRDNHCGIYEQLYEGGSIMPLMLYTCKTELTINRTKELQSLLKEVDDK